MNGGGAAGLGLLGGALALLLGRWALERGRDAFGPAAATIGLVAMVFAPLGVSLAAAAEGYPGAALGIAAGGFILSALVAGVVAASGADGEARGARRFAVIAALATGFLIWTAYNGEVSRKEGALMLLAAVATGVWAVRAAPKPETPARFKPIGLAWLAAGVLAASLGSWAVAAATDRLSAGHPDGDLVMGLSVLAMTVAAPNVILAWRARRAREGGPAFVEIAAGSAVMLLGAVGAAALVRPIPAPETFLGFPVIALAASAVALLGLALAGLRASKPLVAGACAAYVGFLWAFVRGIA